MSKSQINTDQLTLYFEAQKGRAFSKSDLERLFIEKSQQWNLPPSTTSCTFLQMLLKRTRFT
jgi:hypothetical protein